MIITIDGPSGTGKSTVAKGVAKRLGFVCFDTGAMYRSAAWAMLKEGVDINDEEAVREAIGRFCFDIRTDEMGEKRYFVKDVEVTHQIRTQDIAAAASRIAMLSCVRQALVKIQRRFGHRTDAVFEGRDMGTVVFPDAEIKIFLTARPEVRAERRYQELLVKFPDLADAVSFDQILKEIKERDETDSTRSISPLRQAKDAIAIDTSDVSADMVIEQIVSLREKKTFGKYPRQRFSYAAICTFVRIWLRLFYRFKIYGLFHFRPGSGIIAGNHASFLDPPVISASCPEEVHFLAKESLFNIPVLGRLIRHLNSHPVSRDASDARTFRSIVELLESGKKVILFPEGQRTIDGALQPLQRGLSFLAYKARCGILPVYVDGTFEAWDRKSRLPRPWGRIRCVFGSPLEWEEFEGLDKRQAMEQITLRTAEAIGNLKKWLDDGAQGQPP